MRKLILLLLFIVIPLSRGADPDYRVCSAKILGNMIQDRATVNEMISEMEAASSPEDLMSIAGEVTRFAKFLPFRSADCLEGYDTTWRLHQLLNDAYAAQTLRLAGIADADNPFAHALTAARAPLDRHFERLNSILDSGERDDLDESRYTSDPDCYYEDMAKANDSAIEFRTLVDGALAAADLHDLLSYGSAAVAWHDRVWTTLPGCGEIFDYLIEWSRLLNSSVIRRAFELTGLPDLDNPFSQEEYGRFQIGIGETADIFSLRRLHAVKRPTADNRVYGLPNCTLSDLESFAHLPVEFADLVEDGITALSAENKLLFIDRQVEWRRRLWLHMPMCREVLELAWLMYQISTDYAAMHALGVLAQADLDTPYQAEVEAGHSNLLRLGDLLAVYESYRTGESALPVSPGATVFTCGDAVLEESFWDYGDGYRDVGRAAMSIETLDDALQYSISFVGWRAGLFSKLPNCPEGIELVWLSVQGITGHALMRVLEQAGLPSADNPYGAEVEATESRMRVVNRALVGQDPLPKESETPGASRLPECSESESLTVALPALHFFETLDYLRATSIAELLDYAASYLEWRDISFDQFPLCLEAHESRLQFTQVVGDVIARRALDIDGRLYSSNVYRELPNDRERFSQLTDTLYASRRAVGPPPDEREVPACTVDEIATAADLAYGITAIALAAETLDHETGLPAFHRQIINWRGDLMAGLPQCAGAVELGWLMNDISIDLAVLHSLIFAGADAEALPHPAVIADSLARLVQLASELGIDIDAELTR